MLHLAAIFHSSCYVTGDQQRRLGNRCRICGMLGGYKLMLALLELTRPAVITRNRAAAERASR